MTKMVRVEWMDHAFHAGDRDKKSDGLSKQVSIGFLVQETEDTIKLAMSRATHDSGNKSWSEVLTLGKVMVDKVTEIREVA